MASCLFLVKTVVSFLPCMNPLSIRQEIQATIPSSRSLLQTIKSFGEPKNMVRQCWINKAEWLLDIYFLIYKSIQENTFDTSWNKVKPKALQATGANISSKKIPSFCLYP